MKKKIFIFLLILFILVISLFVFFKFFYLSRNYKIEEETKSTIQLNISPEIVFFVVDTPKGEWIISGIDDISDIKNKLSVVSESYNYSGDFDYNMILSGSNIVGIVQGNFLVNGNLIENGNRIIELDFNIEKYLKKMTKHYENNHPESVN